MQITHVDPFYIIVSSDLISLLSVFGCQKYEESYAFKFNIALLKSNECAPMYSKMYY